MGLLCDRIPTMLCFVDVRNTNWRLKMAKPAFYIHPVSHRYRMCVHHTVALKKVVLSLIEKVGKNKTRSKIYFTVDMVCFSQQT